MSASKLYIKQSLSMHVCECVHISMYAGNGCKRSDDSKDIKLIFNKERKVCGSSLSLQAHKIRPSTKYATMKGGARLLRVLDRNITIQVQ